MAWLSILVLCVLAYTLWTIIVFLRNYRKARSLGLPIIITPFNVLNPFWALFQKQLIPYLKRIPVAHDAISYSYFGWPFYDKYATHERLGDAFVVVSPLLPELYIADPEAIDAVNSRREDFPKPVDLFYAPLNVFGRNVDAVDGEEWRRHRKITSPPFNERNSSLVWKESIRQANDMIKDWTSREGVTTTADDTLTLALHVLTSAGFGMSYSFKGDSNLPDGHQMSYRDALAFVLRGIVPIFILPERLFSLPLAPKSAKRLGLAIKEFKAYMSEMVQTERSRITKRDPGTGNLISSLIAASDQAKENALTDDEIYGNLFIYNFAGHETTAHTLAYAFNLLAVNPDHQDWLHEELSHVLGDKDTAALSYDETFPKLKRCLAVMYETLRIYGPTTDLPKYTHDKEQLLTIAGKDYIIPRNVILHLNQAAVQANPRYWGPKSLEWLPDRWIESSNGTDTIKKPPGPKGTYLPWADGPRNCPGKKFSQVEFVAVLATLFRQWKVKPALHEGESMQEARKRVMGVVNDSHVVLTLAMKKPESVQLVWSRR